MWLKPGGKLYIGVPTGSDILYWNAHRTYGRHRWGQLMKRRPWRFLGMFGGEEYSDTRACFGEACGSQGPWSEKNLASYSNGTLHCTAECLWAWGESPNAAPGGPGEIFQPVFVLQKPGHAVEWPDRDPSPPEMGPAELSPSISELARSYGYLGPNRNHNRNPNPNGKVILRFGVRPHGTEQGHRSCLALTLNLTLHPNPNPNPTP